MRAHRRCELSALRGRIVDAAVSDPRGSCSCCCGSMLKRCVTCTRTRSRPPSTAASNRHSCRSSRGRGTTPRHAAQIPPQLSNRRGPDRDREPACSSRSLVCSPGPPEAVTAASSVERLRGWEEAEPLAAVPAGCGAAHGHPDGPMGHFRGWMGHDPGLGGREGRWLRPSRRCTYSMTVASLSSWSVSSSGWMPAANCSTGLSGYPHTANWFR